MVIEDIRRKYRLSVSQSEIFYPIQYVANKKQKIKKRNLKYLYRDDLRNSANTIHEFPPYESVYIPRLEEVLEFDNYEEIKRAAGEFTFDIPFVAEIHNGRIIKKSGICTDQKYRIILDCGRSFQPTSRFKIGSNKELNYLLYKQRKPTIASNDEYDINMAFSLTAGGRLKKGYTNYFDWIHGYLTRFELFEYYRDSTGVEPKVIIPENSPSWLIESIELLGYENKIVTWSPDNELLIKKLIVPSNRRQEVRTDDDSIYGRRKVVSKSACQWLREKATECSNVDRSFFSKKVLISREDAECRHIENREEVFNALRSNGFQSYKLNDLSFPEQVALFDQAEKVVGVHGAGLVNIIFSTNCRVIEITGDVFIPTYYIMSCLMNLEYQAVSGRSIRRANIKKRDQNIKISPKKIINRI